MKPQYKNWMPKGMVLSFLAGTVCFLGLVVFLFLAKPFAGTLQTVLTIVCLLAFLAFLGATIWMSALYRAFSYDGKRQLSRQIIQGTAVYAQIPKGGKGLDVGCGSGALAIACARKNPGAQMIGIDRWGKEYASFSKSLCESNARAEGVSNVTFAQGDANSLAFPDESFDCVVSNYVYHNIPSQDRQAILLETLRVLKKGGTFAIHDLFTRGKYGDMQAFLQKLRDMGYESAELIDTTKGVFMSPREAALLGLSGSALLVGKK